MSAQIFRDAVVEGLVNDAVNRLKNSAYKPPFVSNNNETAMPAYPKVPSAKIAPLSAAVKRLK